MKNKKENKKILTNAWDLIDELAVGPLADEFELDDILMDISFKLIDYRMENNITQKQLAESLLVSQAMVSKLESGEYNPTVELLFKIAKKLTWKFEIVLEESSRMQTWNIDHEILDFTNTEEDITSFDAKIEEVA